MLEFVRWLERSRTQQIILLESEEVEKQLELWWMEVETVDSVSI